FQIARHLRQAEEKESFAPRHERPGLRRAGLYTVFRCHLEGMNGGIARDAKGMIPARSHDFHLAAGAQEGSATQLLHRRTATDWAGYFQRLGAAMLLADDEGPHAPDLYREEFYRITYAPLTERLGFDVKLLRAESQVDPGTDRDATYSSFVL